MVTICDLRKQDVRPTGRKFDQSGGKMPAPQYDYECATEALKRV